MKRPQCSTKLKLLSSTNTPLYTSKHQQKFGIIISRW